MSQKGTALARSHQCGPTEEWVNDDEDADIIIAVRAKTTEIEQCSGRKGEGRIGLGGAVTAIISEAFLASFNLAYVQPSSLLLHRILLSPQ